MSGVGHPLIASRLTSAGRGAVATIRIKGNFADPDVNEVVLGLNSLFAAANGISLSDQPIGKIAFGRWGRADTEELVVCRLDQKTLEVHCHGGDAAVQRILADLADCGCIVTDWRRSRIVTEDFLDVECLEALSQTSTWRTTRIVLEQSNGLLKPAFQQLLQTISFDQKIIEPLLDELLKWANFGLHLTMPWSVVLTGRPNVGKSSLINALLGYQRSIVFDQPGTTRDVVTGETAFEGWPVILADTAGIRDGGSPLEAAGIKLAQDKLRTADLRLVLIDVSQPPRDEDFRLISQWPDAIVVSHKSDLEHRWNDELPENAVEVSSVSGIGLLDLQKRIISQLIPVIPASGTPIPVTRRQVDRLREARQAISVEERYQVLQQLILPDW